MENLKINNEEDLINILNKEDTSSFANFTSIVQTNIHLDLDLDIYSEERLKIWGSVKIDFEMLKDNTQSIILDTFNLNIHSVHLISKDQEPQKLNFIHVENNYKQSISLGSPLIIVLGNHSTQKPTILIKYTANGNSRAYSYIKSDQKTKYPMAYVDNECIGARSQFPCQDSPSVKCKFTAELSTKNPYQVLCSAIRVKPCKETPDRKTFYYEQFIKVPTYLIVFAVGVFETKYISDGCKIFAEQDLIEKAFSSLSKIDHYVSVAEKMLSKYEWEEFNILVLRNYPYYGMENPSLVFIDSNQINDPALIFHELIHSWTGNLVTNKNWENFWINEGLTNFLECKMVKEIIGIDEYNKLTGHYKERLISNVSIQGPKNQLTSLYPNYFHSDPIIYWSSIPYDKGSMFMRYIELLIGENLIMSIIRNLIDKYKYLSIGWEDLRSFFNDTILKNLGEVEGKSIIEQIDWEKWILSPGFPPVEC